MPNPDSGNLETQLGNTPPKFRRKPGGKEPPVNERTANWWVPDKTGPDRSAGIRKLKIHPTSKGL